jgi:hypothetical protein
MKKHKNVHSISQRIAMRRRAREKYNKRDEQRGIQKMPSPEEVEDVEEAAHVEPAEPNRKVQEGHVAIVRSQRKVQKKHAHASVAVTQEARWNSRATKNKKRGRRSPAGGGRRARRDGPAMHTHGARR